MKKCALWFLLVTLLSAVAFTQDKDKDVLPNNFLSGMHVIASHPAPGGPYAAQKKGDKRTPTFAKCDRLLRLSPMRGYVNQLHRAV